MPAAGASRLELVHNKLHAEYWDAPVEQGGGVEDERTQLLLNRDPLCYQVSYKRVAAKLKSPLASDVTEFSVGADSVSVKHPGYTGKVVQSFTLTGSPAVIALRPGAVLPKEAGSRKPEAGKVEALPASVPPASGR